MLFADYSRNFHLIVMKFGKLHYLDFHENFKKKYVPGSLKVNVRLFDM